MKMRANAVTVGLENMRCARDLDTDCETRGEAAPTTIATPVA
jgi:hypothetical protein